jgi:pimeloyl-ACP methyl ester carboxylesterase
VAGSSAHWDPVLPPLAERFQVVAPDLLGHGESAKPRGDYSLGAYASGVRDLLGLLRHDRVTVVGHSLGGGIAMQFAYQFPERCEPAGAGGQRGAGARSHAGAASGGHSRRGGVPPGSPSGARAESWSHEEFLVACLQREVAARDSHGGEGRIRAARFPARKSLKDFDYDHARGLRRGTITTCPPSTFATGRKK